MYPTCSIACVAGVERGRGSGVSGKERADYILCITRVTLTLTNNTFIRYQFSQGLISNTLRSSFL